MHGDKSIEAALPGCVADDDAAAQESLHMFNVCPGCGEYSVDKEIEPDAGAADAAWAVCRTCGHRHRFVRVPLFFLTGASGAGKTTVALELVRSQLETVVLDSDLLWNEHWAQRVSTTDGARATRRPFLDRMVEFNNWLAANAGATRPPMSLVDTTHATIAETARAVTDWLGG